MKIKIMRKGQYKIEQHINSDIKIGDKVKLRDGSGLTHSSNDEGIYIVFGYPKLTGSKLPLMELEFTVVNTNIKDLVCMGVCGIVYLQDIEIEYNGCVFYTCSQFVNKL
jgi:hypothetical protein